MRRLLLLFPLALLLAIAACGPTAQATPEETEQPTEEATAEETESEEAIPPLDLPNSAPELEALLPDEIGAEQAFKLSFTGEELLTDDSGDVTVDPEFLAFLERMGAQPDDISMAMSFAMSESDQAGIVAFRVAGADGNQLRAELQTSMETEEQAGEWSSASIGGKNVLQAEDLETAGNTLYMYVVGDIIFLVTAADEAAAAELLDPLP